MTNAPRPTKNERREQAREAARQAREKQKRREQRTKIFVRGGVTLGIVAVLAVVGLVLLAVNQPAGPGPKNMASGGIVFTGSDGNIQAVTTPGLPADSTPTPTDTTALGTPLNIVTYVDFMCPFCNQFEQTNAAYLQQLVSSGQASLEVHPVAILNRSSQGTEYSTRAGNAAACVANYQPDSFLDVEAALYANQPQEGSTGLSDSQLVDIVKNAGVSSIEVAQCIRNHDFSGFIDAATKVAVNDPALTNPSSGGFSTPTVLVNGAYYTGSGADANAFALFVESQRPATN